MNKGIIFIKIGGKSLENSQIITSIINQFQLVISNDNDIRYIVIITGGGTLADFIRYIDTKINIGDDLAHWQAIISMDRNAEILHNNFPFIELIDNFLKLKKGLREKKFSSSLIIFKPFNYLYQNDPLPHSWNVTSDAIAIHLAMRLKLDRCFLIKDIDGIYNNEHKIIKYIKPSELKELKSYNAALSQKNRNFKKSSQPIDSFSLKLIEDYDMECIILNGNNKSKRIFEYFTKGSEKEKVFSKITLN